MGQVAIEGTGVDGVSVNLSNGNSTTTSGGGNYRFDNVEGGAYTVTISGYPSDATFDATSAAATISSAGQSVTVNFSGAYIRTASVMGSVTVENMGLGGVTVALSGVSSATAVTDDSGQYAFTGLRMGSYSVEISGFDSDEVGFSNTASAVTVGVGESKIVSFDGTYLRTAGIQGRVSVEGAGLEGVNVSLSGGPDGVSETTTTDASGQYSFARLRAGDYAVGISGYDMDDYEFEVTSQNVTVALGETANVPFEGVLLRTSGVSGRVSVEGVGLEGVMVTLSGMDMDDMTAMTDAGGVYAFAGLAAGDYTVAIALSDEQMAAYVFDMTSMDVMVGDDETAIVNFDATHAATASVKVQLFVDEGTKNDMMDEGEMMFPSAEMIQMVAAMGLPLPLDQVVALAGPGVHDMQQGMTMPDGSVMFSGLKAGQYQVIVSDIPAEVLAALPPALAHVLRDYAYGGPPTGYPIALGVGAMETQYAPVDITHTTVNVAVTLKGGEHRGMGLPGAMVTLYADEAGDTKIASGETMMNEAGHAYTSIRFPRAGTMGNMVYMGISSEDYWVDPTADNQAVMWDPMYTMHPMPGAMPPAVLNDVNILNLKVDVSVSGATITTDHGGGKPLAGWAIGIAHGDVVDPAMLDDDGMAEFKVEMPPAAVALLPKPFTFAVSPEQDDELDGGEMFEATPFVYLHTGLALQGTVEGMIELEYTTQTLMVSVYREVDQVDGFTGNIGTGDFSATCIAYNEDDECVTGIELELRHETATNRRNTIDPDVWRWDTSGSDRTVWVDKGNYTFKNLPTDLNLFVLADEIGYVEIVPTDNLAAYEDADVNGIEGSAFGSEGGFHHTVSLCPGRSVDPTGQDHGECGSFGFVPTHVVAAHVKKMIVRKDNDDGFRAEQAINVDGVELGLTPVMGKNIAGEADAIMTLESPVRSAGEGSSSSAWDDQVDERQDLYFGRVAEGVYGVSLSDDWSAVADGAVVGKEYRLDEDDVMDVTALTGADGPFRTADEEGVYFEVRPTTSTLYGIVLDDADDPLEDVEVTVNGVTVMTDIDGRYIVPDFSRVASRASRTGGKLYVSFSKDGYDTQRDDPNNSRSSRRYQITDADGATDGIDFAANDPTRLDVVLEESAMLAVVTGTVTDKDGEPVSGVDLTVMNEDGEDVLFNRQWISAIGAYCTVGEGDDAMNCRRTGDDGTYEMQVRVTEDDEDYTITPSKNRYYFDNTDETERLEVGDDEDGVDFEALRQSRIRGAVKDADDNGMAGVTVTAEAQGRDYSASDETNDNGRFIIWVDGDERYDVSAEKDGYSFTDPEDGDNLGLRVDDDETHDIGTFTATAVPSDVSTLKSLTATPGVMDPEEFDPETTTYTAKVGYTTTSTRIEAEATSSAATVTITAGENEEMGTGSASMDVDLEVGDMTVTISVESEDESTTTDYTLTVTREANMPSAPQNLEATSPAGGQVTVTWDPPSNAASFTGYETRIGNGAWTASAGTATGGELAVTTGLQNGIDETFWVRTVTTVDGTTTPGDSASITAAPWPIVSSVEFAPTTIAESDDPDTDGAQDSTLVTITVDGTAFADFDVMLDFADEMQSDLLSFTGQVTIPRGQTTAEVVAMAVDNDIDASAADATVTDPVVVLEATLVPAEAEDRDAVAAGTGVTITDDDVAPTAPTAVTSTQVGTTSTFEVTWTFVASQWGTGAEASRKFQYRVKNAAFTDTAADNALWMDVAGGTSVRAVNVTLEAPATGTVTYNIEVRAVTEAGNGAAGATTQDRAAS